MLNVIVTFVKSSILRIACDYCIYQLFEQHVHDDPFKPRAAATHTVRLLARVDTSVLQHSSVALVMDKGWMLRSKTKMYSLLCGPTER